MSESNRVRIAFVGCVAEGLRSLETLLELGEHVVAVFTLHPELAAGVSASVRWEPITSRHGIPLHYVRNMNDPDAVARLRDARPHLLFCVGWTQLLRRSVLEIPPLGCIGFHASLLPRYRGRAPVNWAIIRGETRTGNTMMLLDEGVDTGDIVAQREFAIDEEDTCATVYDKVAKSEDEMIREVMPLIRAGRMPRRPQDHSRATVMPRRRPEDGQIDWSRTTKELHDWVRALTHPYPGAFTWIDGVKVSIWKASRWSPERGRTSSTAGPAGWFRAEGDAPRLLVRTGDGDLELHRLQREGEDEVDGLVFASRHLATGGTVATGRPE